VSRVTWFDLSGRVLESIGPPGNYLNLSLGADGRRVFYDRTRPGIGTFDIWSLDLGRGVESPITTDPETEFGPLDLRDGKNIVYSANRGGAVQLFRRDLESGADARLTDVPSGFQQVQDLSPDGRTLAYVERTPQRNFDIWTLAVPGPGKPAPFLQSPFDKKDVRFSPDGRFLAFVSNESGQAEAYVAPFPGPGEKVRLSAGGARLVRWGREGNALFTSPRTGGCVSRSRRPVSAGGPPSLPIRTSRGSTTKSRDGTGLSP
jgi:Tol biopolymer transport system component